MNESMIKLASRFIPGKKKRREFKEIGCVVNDPSIVNFMKHKNLL